MTSIFGYDTIADEIVGLINASNATQSAAFTSADLTLTKGLYDQLENRQYFDITDNSGKYFGVISGAQFFKRDFQVLFKGITINVQAKTGATNREILEVLCTQQGLPPFEDNDFADGLMDLVTDVGDTETLISWPLQPRSWAWTGNVTFYLRNLKKSLTTLLSNGDLTGVDQVTLGGLFWPVDKTDLDGITQPTWSQLDKVITTTYLDGLEYPGDTDLGQIINVTLLDGLYYPSAISLPDFTVSNLDGLEYPPTVAIDLLNGSLDGIDYPVGSDPAKISAYTLTRPVDLSNYGNAIAAYRVGSQITDSTLVNAIVGEILITWPSLNTEAMVKNLTVAFSSSTVLSIVTKRSASYGWRTTVTVNLSTHSVFVGNAVLQYDTEVFS